MQDIRRFFPSLPQDRLEKIEKHIDSYRFFVTPYTLACVGLDDYGNPLPNDPIWRQLHCEDCDYTIPVLPDSNWEVPEEIHYEILHQKYPGRALIRITDTCFSYCTYCYCAHRTIDNNKNNQIHYKSVWPQILSYLKEHSDIYEILISGGDPLILSNEELSEILQDLRSIPSIRFIRINTRAFTYCPFRIDTELVRILKKFDVNAIEVHFSSHKELTPQVDEILDLFSLNNYNPMFLSRAPLLKGVNNGIEELEALFLELYQRGIFPYYMFHFAPYVICRDQLGTTVSEGISLLNYLRRRIPGPAMPRYTLFHQSGKQDIPFDENGTAEFRYLQDQDGKPYITFRNWRGVWVDYPDVV